nr:sulfurtransferase [Oleiagrimonas sp. C23AA]
MAPEAVLIVDCRFDLADPAQGRREYAKAHLPGAVYAHLDEDLSDHMQPATQGRHPLPQAADFAAKLARWGWRPGLALVAYDDAGGALAAARCWWMARALGLDAAVLDGGLGAWISAGLPLTDRMPERAACEPVPGMRFDASATLSADGLLDAPRILDARAAPRFAGQVEPLDPVAGHVPGARNRPFAENLDEHGRFRPAETLRAAFGALLPEGRADGVVHMCGSGVTACHNLLAMEVAGLHGSRLFAPSWSGWVADASRPVERND